MSESALYHNFEASLAVDSGATVEFFPSSPVKVVRAGFVVTTAMSTTAAIITIDHDRADGADLDPVGTAEGGTLTATAVDMAVNLGVYADITSSVTGEPIIVLPGEMLTATVTTTSSSGVVRFFYQYEVLPFVDWTLRRDIDSTIPGAAQLTTALGTMTKVTA